MDSDSFSDMEDSEIEEVDEKGDTTEHSTRLIQLGSHLFYNTHVHVFDIQLFEIIILLSCL